MKFGLFGGAVLKNDGNSGDSLGYEPFMDIVLEAESLGFQSMFLVEHHFGGDGQISSSLNLLSHISALTSKGSTPSRQLILTPMPSGSDFLP